MDLTLKVCILPFTEYEFYRVDHIEKLSKKIVIKEYREYFNDSLLKCMYNIIHKKQRVENLDEIILLFDKFYPKVELNNSHNNITEYYLNLLSKITKSFISHRNGRIALKYWESSGEEDFIGPYKGINKIALWNSLNRIFTTDLLVVKYLLDNGMKDEVYLNGYYSSIMIEDLQLEQVLKKGVAETHIHKGAAINFYISWQYLMTLTNKTYKSYKEELFIDEVIGKSYGLEYYVISMAIVRVIMTTFIIDNESSHDYEFLNYLKSYHEDDSKLKFLMYMMYKFNSVESEMADSNQGKSHTKKSIQDRAIFELVRDIEQGKEIIKEKYRFFDLWDRLKEKLGIKQGEDLEKNIIEKDILNQLLGVRTVNTATENIFLFKSMRYIEENDQDCFFSKIFWQYIRIKNEVFQLKVQGNLVRGLINFQSYYKRSSTKNIKGYTDKEYWKLIMKNQMQNLHLKKLELRASPGGGGSKEEITGSIKKTITNFFQAYLDIIEEDYVLTEDTKSGEKIYKEVPIVGLVFHMLKVPDENGHEKCWIRYGGKEATELYFRDLQDQYRRQVQAINEIREKFVGLSEYILGIDAASIENNTEPWVFAPIYDEARDSKTHKMIYSNSSRLPRIKNLGFTFHVGEDFRHLVTGIRRVDEVVEHFKFHAGDRIGHGIALGLDVDKWVLNNKIVILPRGEYLENLLWIWGLYKDGKYSTCFDMGYLQQEIMKFAEKIYIQMEGINTYALWKAYRNKFKVFKVLQRFLDCYDDKWSKQECHNHLFCSVVQNTETRIWNEEKLTHAQHCKCYIERMLEPVQIEIKLQDLEMMKHVQKIVASKVSREGIIVETNPSSNVAIGEIESIFHHYIHNLNHVGMNKDENPENSVMISINSDDPSVFNTNVSNEFAYVFYSLQEKGYSREVALLWIDKVRKYGMESSFIDDRGLRTEERIEEIKGIINKLKN
ncbi:hypothetical protein [Clostridium estertheticum]|nr:hypothetical protein [Clostridium estertheticum]